MEERKYELPTVYKRLLKGLFFLSDEKELLPFIADEIVWRVEKKSKCQ